jgi:hypothetical protein
VSGLGVSDRCSKLFGLDAPKAVEVHRAPQNIFELLADDTPISDAEIAEAQARDPVQRPNVSTEHRRRDVLASLGVTRDVSDRNHVRINGRPSQVGREC